MNHKMSRAEQEAWDDLAKAALRVQRFQQRRKNARRKEHQTDMQRQEMISRRIKFAASFPVNGDGFPVIDGVRSDWIQVAKIAKKLGLYSKTTYAVDISGTLQKMNEESRGVA